MQGRCSICMEFKRDVDLCPECREMVCIDCYRPKHGCCLCCMVDGKTRKVRAVKENENGDGGR